MFSKRRWLSEAAVNISLIHNVGVVHKIRGDSKKLLLLRERAEFLPAGRVGKIVTCGLCELGIKKAPQFYCGAEYC
jgi:hypothetical protein